MSASPRDQTEPEAADTQSPAENDNTADQQNNGNDEENMTALRPEDVGYDFEVKEQDRWLPIANGEYRFDEFLLHRVLHLALHDAPCYPCPLSGATGITGRWDSLTAANLDEML